MAAMRVEEDIRRWVEGNRGATRRERREWIRGDKEVDDMLDMVAMSIWEGTQVEY